MPTIPQSQYYVYILARPNGKPFYVGKGKGDRVFRHEIEARKECKCHRCNVIRKIWRNGGEVQRYIVFTTDDEQEAFAYERDQIAEIGRKNLANGSDGGEGPGGVVYTQEYRELRRKMQLENFQNPDFVARYKAGVAQRKVDPEHISRMIAVRNADPGYRERARQRAIEQYADPEQRRNISEKIRAHFADPEKRRVASEKQKRVWEDPEYRAKMTAKLAEARAARQRKRGLHGKEEAGTT